MPPFIDVSNSKTKMSFTDLIPQISLSGISNPLSAVSDFLFRPGTSGWQEVSDIFDSVDFLITMIKNPIISLFINPQSITVNKTVLLNKQVTRGGFVIQFWGHDLETISIRAETGYFGLSKVPLQVFELFKDYCYQGRYSTKKPFKAMPLITMLYEGQALRGYFNNLTYTVVQQRPYIITYDFTFTVVENVSIPILSTAVTVFNRFSKPYQSSGKTAADLTDKLRFTRGWGVKLY